MGFFSRFEKKIEDGVEGAASALEKSSLTPVQITKKAEKQMKREKLVGAGKQIAPTLYTVLVSADDDARLVGYYPTLAGEVETYLIAKAGEEGYVMDGKPLVRFIVDPDLKKGKFDVIAELVSSNIIEKLRAEENKSYGIKPHESHINMDHNNREFNNVPRQNRNVNMSNLNERPNNPAVKSGRSAIPQEVAKVHIPNSNIGQPGAEFNNQINSPEIGGIDVLAQDNYAIDNYSNVQNQSFNNSEVVEAPLNLGNKNMNPAVAEDVYLYDEASDMAYKLTGKSQKIGRESVNDIVISDINASRVHAEIHKENNGTWVVSDLNSTNGLFVNGRRVKSAPLSDADIILIGTTRLEFQLLTRAE